MNARNARAGFILSCVAALATGRAQAADAWVPDSDACHQAATTIDIVQCLNKRTELWDKRLNEAWRAVTTMLGDPASKAQLAALKDAQRAWLKYRDANCAYYATNEGTIRQVEVAGCMQEMTQNRAIELQSIGPH